MAYTTINKHTDYFNTVLYTGNGSNGRAITGVGHQPDLVWIKNRDATEEHLWYDVVRGADKLLRSNNTAGDATTSTTTYFNSFDSDGFTVGSETGMNANGQDIAAWNWKANGSGSSNSNGSITSTVSVNTTAGFSIVKWTGNGVAGASIGHGLGVIPKLILVKRTNADGNNWTVYHASLGNTHRLELNNDTVSTSDAGAWNNQTPTANVFYTGNNTTVGNNGSTYIAYCFAKKTGYNSFGIYTGLNSSNGNFIYTGFKPSFIITKRTDASGGWRIYDTKRFRAGGPNNKFNYLRPHQNSVEGTTDSGGAFDMVSNGFKFYTSEADLCGSGNYIYMAFGQSLVGSNNVPCTAR